MLQPYKQIYNNTCIMINGNLMNTELTFKKFDHFN